MLRRNPLVEFFGLAGRVDSSLALQELLLKSIDALKPQEDDSAQTNAWRAYDLLFFRYVRGYERLEVANQLGISDRQLSREQRTALETLVHFLLKVRSPAVKIGDSNGAVPVAAALSESAPPAIETQPGESGWLDNLPADNPTAWKPVFLSVITLLRSLGINNGAFLVYPSIDNLPDLSVPQNALRHSLLNILGALIPLPRQSLLRIEPSVAGGVLRIIVSTQSRGEITPTAAAAPRIHALPSVADGQLPEHPGLEVARNLVENAGGTIQVTQQAGQLVCSFTIPTLAQVSVLVMDDHPDIIQLFQRYGQGTRYSILGASNPNEFLRALETHQPRIIILDLMMPDMDGWDFLLQLRQNAQTRRAAIILCSILPQKSLALALGADDFLQKPVLPQDFIHALNAAFDRLQGEEIPLHPKESDE